MKKIFTLVLLLISSTGLLLAQSAGILKGQVTDSKGRAIEAATISILTAADKKLQKITTTDKQGKFELNNLPDGEYLVQVSAVGFATYNSAVQTVRSGRRSY